MGQPKDSMPQANRSHTTWSMIMTLFTRTVQIHLNHILSKAWHSMRHNNIMYILVEKNSNCCRVKVQHEPAQHEMHYRSCASFIFSNLGTLKLNIKCSLVLVPWLTFIVPLTKVRLGLHHRSSKCVSPPQFTF